MARTEEVCGPLHEVFGNADERSLAVYDDLAAELIRRAGQSFDSGEDWPAKVRAGLARLLSELAAQPELTRIAAIELPANVPWAQGHYRATLRRFLPFLDQGLECAVGGAELPSDVATLAIGGAEAIIFDEIAAGRTSDLPDLLPEIVFAVLVPYVGPERAKAETVRARAD